MARSTHYWKRGWNNDRGGIGEHCGYCGLRRLNLLDGRIRYYRPRGEWPEAHRCEPRKEAK